MSQIYNAFVKAGFSPAKPLAAIQAPRVFRVPHGTVRDAARPQETILDGPYIRNYYLGFKSSNRVYDYARTFGVRSFI
jgi:hypothetical protein